MQRALAVLAVILAVSIAGANPPKTDKEFPVVVGTKFTFTSAEFKDTWTTGMAGTRESALYDPHHDTMNYFALGGFHVRADGIYIAGETISDMGLEGPTPMRAIAFPIKKGGVGKVRGLFETTYTVLKREKIKVKAGSFHAWKIGITSKPNPPGAVWLAPGVGIVKIQLPSGRVDELVEIKPPR
jgi:hypothetical protein